MAKRSRPTAVLLMHCPDQKGLVAAVTDFLHKNNGNIIDLDQHVDRNARHFFMRVEWELEGFSIPEEKIDDFFGVLIGQRFDMVWQLHITRHQPRLALFVSKSSHCLYDILQRYVSGEWDIEIPLIISNHPDLEPIAQRYGIEYHCLPITKENRARQEASELALLQENHIDLVVLARYMQILSPTLIDPFANRMINIHHSFLPAFAGARPYHQAHERGVKVIGATSHYVTEDLDAGPIIVQDVTSITHKDSVADLVRKGKDLEKLVLSRAIWLHVQHKVLTYGNRTIVF